MGLLHLGQVLGHLGQVWGKFFWVMPQTKIKKYSLFLLFGAFGASFFKFDAKIYEKMES